MVNCCGLVSEKNEPVPLKSISVELQVQDHVASVRSCLQYVNEEQRPLEAVFVFPLPADAAVCHFSARIGEQEIRAELQDRQSARDQYDDAVSSGQQAFLLEESEESSDVFRLSVGCLSPGQNASISIVYIIELSIQADHALRFCLPAVLNPRYTPAASAAGVVPEVSSASVIPYTLSLSVEVRSSDRISRLESSCALDPLEFLDVQHTHAMVNLSAGHRFDKDVELFLYYENSHQPSAVVEAAASAAQSESRFLSQVCLLDRFSTASTPTLKDSFRKTNRDHLLLSLLSQLFIFTDGEVWNTKEVLDLVKSHVYSHRCFSFGIGEGASTALITGMAREGSGHAQFITGTDRMQPKVMQSLRFALQPAVDNISVDWTVPEGVTVDMLSPPINTLFQGQRALIYAQIKGQSSGKKEGALTVKYRLKDQPVTNQLQFTLKPTEDTGLTIHRLAARSVIRSLELEERAGGADAENIRRRIVELSVQAGVSSAHTAFIGVNKDSKQTVKGPLLQRRVPVPHMFQMSAMQGRCMAMCANTAPKVRSAVMCKRKKRSAAPMVPKMAFCSAMPMSPQMAFDSTMLCSFESSNMMVECDAASYEEEAEPQKDPLLQLVSLQKAAGCWELNASLAAVFGKTEDEVTNQKAAQVDGSVWATVLALIWFYAFKSDQQDEWQFVAMKAASWIRSQKPDGLSQCVCDGNVLLGCQVTEDMLGI
ncbi:von Willebrand factor A domain-containing protein 5A-like [Sinocyclocheilus rhinocerous]|uniref:von Willebrand factor A domain-containing protein 5A-like n=1 Tax=Sinocyclocheilus rhinocerous TaxID=307959 RepID=UPI0007BA1374|nr:PREDICTED: von Willebrand factor A domain-containing protein 5A-like [Sinocyclocheilus rhinocerous]